MMNNSHAPQLPMTACYAPLSHGSLFSGIGGFDLAAEWVGWQNRFHCEWNEFGQRILKHYWPNAISYGDITKTDFTIHRGTIDVLTGGFPCQPYSLAGKRLGKEDERHLWPEMLRAIHEIAPRYIVGENVAGLLSWNGGLVFDEVQTDLEAAGYEIQPVILPACAVNAPHKRERVWFIAHARCSEWQNGLHGQEQGRQTAEFGNSYTKLGAWTQFPITEPTICSGNDGISPELDGITFPKWRNESIKAFGNAIVPQVAYQIFKAIQLHDASLSGA